MAEGGQKDLLSRLADAGEEAIQRLASSPGADRVMGVVTNMRDQVDALTTRVRGIEQLEKRVAALERKVDRLARASSAAPARKRKASASRKTTTRKTT
jgi:phage shock protein A